ncbi:MAG: prepilin-type N-terminal cleavage/methylation domain-containing protein [Candidatus Paceibacteria bacterium]|jgi:prepilin-type N-terminal cleavage/methylation domain-containing protein
MNSKKGFTLIELLVVIAIIGILSSVVLASLNTAREKGDDAAIKSNLANARVQAALFYDDNSNSYTNVCTDEGGIAKAVAAASADCDPSADGTAWAAESALSTTGEYFCVDSTGAGSVTTTTKTGAGTVCL